MNKVKTETNGLWSLLLALSIFSLTLFGSAERVLAHGGEDHSDEKPKVATAAKGIVSRTVRLGDLEITMKHPVLEPDTAAAARLFITKYETNEAAGDIVPTVEIESSGGAVTPAAVEKTETAGSYNLKIPALTEGSYTMRATFKKGEASNTATFSGVEVVHSASPATAAGGSSWLGSALFYLAGLVVLGLFASLFYFAWRMAAEKQVRETPVEA